jgi:signal peptidase I
MILTGLLAIAGLVTFLGAAAWLVRRRYVAVTVEGESMSPTYPAGSRVLVRRTGPEAIRRGQVVVFTGFPPVLDGRARFVIKRAAAVPGDPVPRDTVPALRSVPEQHIPPRRLVVLGDRPDHSYDSRQYGYLAAERIMGVVVRSLT